MPFSLFGGGNNKKASAEQDEAMPGYLKMMRRNSSSKENAQTDMGAFFHPEVKKDTMERRRSNSRIEVPEPVKAANKEYRSKIGELVKTVTAADAA